jgi:aminomethyltransferase
MRRPESVCSESVRPRGRDAEGAISARKRSGPRTADGGCKPRGFWRVADPLYGSPTEGERRARPRDARLISQVTGQKGGRHLVKGCACRLTLAATDPEYLLGRQTPLFSLHQELGARLVDFGGWDMPVQYGSQIGEHHAVRRAAGVFDVSHMCVIDLHGTRARGFLERLLANDVGRLRAPGRALYSCLLNESGGILDDLIVYYLGEQYFRLVVNAGTRDRDLAWIRTQAHAFGVEVKERTDLAMLAVQGPEARAKAAQLLSPADAMSALGLEVFQACELEHWFVARTGYTGEDGFEIMMPSADAVPAWRSLNSLGVASCGLGARDTLRLEAGMNLYGNDMDEGTQPFESALGWTVALRPAGRDFIGRRALEPLAAGGSPRKLVGLILEDRGVLRSHQKVIVPALGEGEITSGTFSPTLERSIAFARVPAGTADAVQVDVRGKLLRARVVKPPFVRFGRPLVT